jgi:hypothetical protein
MKLSILPDAHNDKPGVTETLRLSRNKIMADKSPARNVVQRIAMMCEFMGHPAIKTAVEQAVPVTVPPAPGALGFDIPLWVGLGMVGLWAALDGFADRAGLKKTECTTCGSKVCIATRFACYTQENEGQSLKELEDLRHLYAHNYAGEADDEYFGRNRHVLGRGVATPLTCGTIFDGRRASLDLPHLRLYSRTVQNVLERI